MLLQTADVYRLLHSTARNMNAGTIPSAIKKLIRTEALTLNLCWPMNSSLCYITYILPQVETASDF